MNDQARIKDIRKLVSRVVTIYLDKKPRKKKKYSYKDRRAKTAEYHRNYRKGIRKIKESCGYDCHNCKRPTCFQPANNDGSPDVLDFGSTVEDTVTKRIKVVKIIPMGRSLSGNLVKFELEDGTYQVHNENEELYALTYYGGRQYKKAKAVIEGDFIMEV